MMKNMSDEAWLKYKAFMYGMPWVFLGALSVSFVFEASWFTRIAFFILSYAAFKFTPYDWNNEKDRRWVKVLARNNILSPVIRGAHWLRTSDGYHLIPESKEND